MTHSIGLRARQNGLGLYSESYGYDLSGNRTSVNTQTYTYAPANQYQSVPPGYAFSYDNDGNLTAWNPNTAKADTDPKLAQELAASQREVRRLKRQLERATALLDLQKKVSEALGLSLEPVE